MTVSGYLRRGKRRLDAWAMEPWLKYLTEGALYGGGALLLCAHALQRSLERKWKGVRP